MNIESLLLDMRREASTRHDDVISKIDELKDLHHDMDKRVESLENTRKTMRWAGSVTGTAIGGAILSWAKNALLGRHSS